MSVLRFRSGSLRWLLLLAFACSVSGQETVVVEVNLTNALGPARLPQMALGQGGLSAQPMWNNRVAEIKALRPALIRLFIQEYFDLLPEPGRTSFNLLDQSVDTIRAAGAKPLMCICFKPRLLFPEINQDIVEPNNYEQWEQLIFDLVRHYRERGAGIRYWEIGNEPDIGESGGCPYRFKPDSYVRYYERTAAAILRADPEARVGGPALANVRSPILPALLSFCDTNRTPLHFVSWHIYSSSPKSVRGTIDYAKGLLQRHPTLQPETFLDEWNMDLTNPPLDPRFQPCYIAETIREMLDAGLDYSCYYHIRDYYVDFDTFARFMSRDGVIFMTRWWNRMPQFDGLFDYQDTPRPSYFVYKLLTRLAGNRLELNSNSAPLRGLATIDPQLRMYNVLLWNFSTNNLRAEIVLQHAPRDLRLRQVTLDARAAGQDENSRLRPAPPTKLGKEQARISTEFDGYGVQLLMLE